MNRNYAHLYIGVVIILTATLISSALKYYAIVEWSWFWALSPFWGGFVLLYAIWALGIIGRDISKAEKITIVKKRTKSESDDPNRHIEKALHNLREAKKHVKWFETTGDPVQRALEKLKAEKEYKVDKAVEKMKKDTGKD